jgi:hypothetical protein
MNLDDLNSRSFVKDVLYIETKGVVSKMIAVAFRELNLIDRGHHTYRDVNGMENEWRLFYSIISHHLKCFPS